MADTVKVPGKGKAIASLIMGIVSIVFALIFSFIPVVGLIPTIIAVALGIVGLVLSSGAKKEGFDGGLRTAAFVLSLIGLILSAIGLVACQSCAACAACEGAGLASSLGSLGSFY